MKATTVLGVASALMRRRKYKILIVGAQFAYLGYRLIKQKRKRNAKRIAQ